MQSSQPEGALGPVTLAGLKEAQDPEDSLPSLPVSKSKRLCIIDGINVAIQGKLVGKQP